MSPPVSRSRYVIIGGGGFLGKELITKLLSIDSDYEIVVVDPNPQVFQLTSFDSTQVEYIKGSFLDEDVLNEALEGASSVFHLASIGHTGLVAGNQDAVFRFNVDGTKFLIEKCKKFGVKRFHYASSVAVAFIGVPLDNASEDDPLPDPKLYLDYYSASKAEAEKYVKSQSTDEFKTVCLRFRAIYGPEDPNVTTKVANLIKKGLFVGMVSMHGRESVSNASSGKNCAKAFVLADEVMKKPDGLHGQVYYIMDKETMGQYEFWLPLVKALGKTPPSLFIPYEFMNLIVPYFAKFCYTILRTPPLLTKFELLILATDNTYSIAKAQKELGYEPEPSSMPEVVEYYQQKSEYDVESSFVDWNLIISIISLIAGIWIYFFLA